jgi:hypothetical protein
MSWRFRRWYIFQLLLRRKSMNSLWLRSVLFWHRYITTCATNHRIARCLFGGHMRNCGRIVQSSVMCLGSICSKDAILVFIHTHDRRPSPHSVILCCIVSISPHFWHCGFGVSFILCKRSFVGRRSCMVIYHSPRSEFVIDVVCKFVHIVPQSYSNPQSQQPSGRRPTP